MKTFLQVVLFLGIVSTSFGWEYARCQFRGTSYSPNITGYAYFVTSQTPNSVDMYVSVSGISENLAADHGIHIHELGDLSDTTSALSVGTHYNPSGSPSHGCEGQSTNWHDGDTGNWYVDSYGTISSSKTLSLPKLSGVNSIIGRAVVIHNKTDDCATTSSSAARLGFCVIGIGNPTSYPSSSSMTNSASSGASTVPIAVCDLQQIGTSGVTGRIWFTPSTDGVQVDAFVNNITGTHGIHVHEYGDLSISSNGNSTGSHYNPLNTSHGIPPFEERHVGDLGNIYHTLNSSTMAYSYLVQANDGKAPTLNLTGLNNIIGRAVVIHSSPDNCSQPTGGSGSRVAFCVIGIGNSSTVSGMIGYTSVPTTQDDSLCGSDDSAAYTLLTTSSLIFWAFVAILF